MLEFAQSLQATPLSVTLQSIEWIVPLTQSVHIVTIGIVFVSILVVALRVRGRLRTDEPPAAVVARFSAWIRGGLVVLALTGLILVLAEPVRELMSLSFWIKMALLAIGIASALLFRRSLVRRAAPAARAPEFSAAARSLAVVTVVLWLAIIFLGRAIAYDIEVWGALSLSPRA